jgi:hypothetical protein
MAKFNWETDASPADLDDAQEAFEDYLQVENAADKSARHMFYWGFMFGKGLIKGVNNEPEKEVGAPPTARFVAPGDQSEARNKGGESPV